MKLHAKYTLATSRKRKTIHLIALFLAAFCFSGMNNYAHAQDKADITIDYADCMYFNCNKL